MNRFRIFELSALLIGNKAERAGKHLQRTAAFSLGPRFHIGCKGLVLEDPALRTKKQSVRGKPLNSRRPYGRWNRIKVLRYRE